MNIYISIFASILFATGSQASSLRKSSSRRLVSSNDEVETIEFTTENGDCDFDLLANALQDQCGDGCDLISLLGRNLDEATARAAVDTLCHEALQESITSVNPNNPNRGGTAYPFYNITSEGFQFDNNFFDGGTALNAEYEPVKIIDSQGGGEIQNIFDTVAQSELISSPDYLGDNFIDGCEAQAIMCCWVQDRQANDNNGNCNNNDCFDKDPADNTDVCYTDLAASTKSNHVEGGFAIFPGDTATTGEGDAHCHGFAWSNDVTAPDYRYRGNALFFVSMYDHLETRGYVRNVPGAPMCSCIDKSPTVSRSDCTNVEVEETFVFRRVFRNERNNFIREASIESKKIEFNNCPTDDGQNNDLGRWYDQEYRGQSDVSDEVFDKHIVDDCNEGDHYERFLDSKGYALGNDNCQPVEAGTYHVQVSFGTSGGFGGEQLLSTTSNGRKVDLYSHDDNSGRQKWVITPIDNCLYHIHISGGTSGGFGGEQILSTTGNGRKVDLYSHDDNSGRQKWRIKLIPGTSLFHIQISGGTNGGFGGQQLLSTTSDGTHVDLYSHDDDSGRQKWRIIEPSTDDDGTSTANCQPPVDAGTYHIQISGGTSGGAGGEQLLSTTSNGRKVDLYSHDDNSGRQKWVITPIDNCLYHISISGGTSGGFGGAQLLSTTGNGRKVDLYSHDDNSGRQKWKIKAISGSSDLFHIQISGGTSGGFGGQQLLSTTGNGRLIDLYSHDDNSGRQKWVLNKL